MTAVAKIKTGDILLGTKNLRHWLRQASTALYLKNKVFGAETAWERFGEINRIKPCRIGRNDEFMVACNRGRVLIVWCPQRRLLIPFINPSKSDCPPEQVRINKNIFSTWFIRTDRKQVDLTSWSQEAYAAWLYFHMGITSIASIIETSTVDNKGITWHFPQVFPEFRPNARVNSMPLLRDRLNQSLMTRTIDDPRTKNNNRGVMGRTQDLGIGPAFSEIPTLSRYIDFVKSHPNRVR